MDLRIFGKVLVDLFRIFGKVYEDFWSDTPLDLEYSYTARYFVRYFCLISFRVIFLRLIHYLFSVCNHRKRGKIYRGGSNLYFDWLCEHLVL